MQAPTVPMVQADGKGGERIYFSTDDEPERKTPW